MGRGDRLQQGTWVHPRVAINLGQWISPAFDVKVSGWVTDWMMGRDIPGAFMPEHVRRFLKNRAKIPHTHFSMLNEIYLNLFATLEDYGVIPPDKIIHAPRKGHVSPSEPSRLSGLLTVASLAVPPPALPPEPGSGPSGCYGVGRS